MTPEQLLQPRYLVIADYPVADLNIGDIYQFENIHPFSGYSLQFGKAIIAPKYFDKFPHLFRRLEWWEHRNPKDMPEYVKTINGKSVYKFYGFGSLGNSYAKVKDDEYRSNYLLSALLPATKEEYDNYKTVNI